MIASGSSWLRSVHDRISPSGEGNDHWEEEEEESAPIPSRHWTGKCEDPRALSESGHMN
jgi:hypothetical protein